MHELLSGNLSSGLQLTGLLTTDPEVALESFVLRTLRRRPDLTYRDLTDELSSTLARVTERLKIRGELEEVSSMPARYRIMPSTLDDLGSPLFCRFTVTGRPIGSVRGKKREARKYLDAVRAAAASRRISGWPKDGTYWVGVHAIFSKNRRGILPDRKILKVIVEDACTSVLWADPGQIRTFDVLGFERLPNLIYERLEVSVRVL